MTSITGLPFERNTMTAVEVDELNALRKFWNENHDRNGNELVPEAEKRVNKKAAVEAIDKLVAEAHKFANVNASDKCKEFADASLAIAQAVLTMEKV